MIKIGKNSAPTKDITTKIGNQRLIEHERELKSLNNGSRTTRKV